MRRTVVLCFLLLLTAGCASTDTVPGGTASAVPHDTYIDHFMHHRSREAGAHGADVLLTFAAIGDWGAGTDAEEAIADRMCAWRRSHPFDLVVTAGDNIYDVGSPSDFEAKFFQPMACLLDAGVKFHSALGNHDVITDDGEPEIDEPRFGMPAHNYVRRDSGVRFVFADSNALDRDWLRKALVPDEGDLWTIVLFHHPVYSPGDGHGSTPGFRPSLPRMFRRKGVDLVINGHDHIYAVTRPLRKIRYVVTGGGGAALYGCTEQWFSENCQERNHFLYVTVHADRIVVEAVPDTGHPFDRFTSTGRS